MLQSSSPLFLFLFLNALGHKGDLIQLRLACFPPSLLSPLNSKSLSLSLSPLKCPFCARSLKRGKWPMAAAAGELCRFTSGGAVVKIYTEREERAKCRTVPLSRRQRRSFMFPPKIDGINCEVTTRIHEIHATSQADRGCLSVYLARRSAGWRGLGAGSSCSFAAGGHLDTMAEVRRGQLKVDFSSEQLSRRRGGAVAVIVAIL